MPAPKDMVLLTVSGAIGKTNRGPLDAGKDSLLALQKISFARAFAFDRAMLLGLKQGTVKVQPPEFQAPATFTGPLLQEVLAAVGAARGKVIFTAIDGYTGWLRPGRHWASDWILALDADGVTARARPARPALAASTRAPRERGRATTHQGAWVWCADSMHQGRTKTSERGM